MPFPTINWLAVLVCTLLCMVTGSIWYNPKTFFPMWWKVVGNGTDDPGMKTNMTMTWILTVLSSIVQAIFMAFIVSIWGSKTGGATALSGLTIGLVLWVGLIAPMYLVNKLFAGHGLKIWAIETGNHLVNLLLFGAILGAWH